MSLSIQGSTDGLHAQLKKVADGDLSFEELLQVRGWAEDSCQARIAKTQVQIHKLLLLDQFLDVNPAERRGKQQPAFEFIFQERLPTIENPAVYNGTQYYAEGVGTNKYPRVAIKFLPQHAHTWQGAVHGNGYVSIPLTWDASKWYDNVCVGSGEISCLVGNDEDTEWKTVGVVRTWQEAVDLVVAELHQV